MKRSAAVFLVVAACHEPAPSVGVQPSRDVAHPAVSIPDVELVVRYSAGAQPEQRLPMVIAIHGLGDTPEDFFGVMLGLHAAARVILPRGIDAWSVGRSWFARNTDGSAESLAPGIERARDGLLRAVRVATSRYPTCGRPIVMGFSQGAMLTYALAAREPSLFAAAFPVGGMLPLSLGPGPQFAGSTLPTVVGFHGDADRMVPLDDDREIDQRFRARGFPGELRVFNGVPHAIPPAMATELTARIEDAIRMQGCESAGR